MLVRALKVGDRIITTDPISGCEVVSQLTKIKGQRCWIGTEAPRHWPIRAEAGDRESEGKERAA